MTKVRIKKTGEIVNAETILLDTLDSWGMPIKVGFDEIELIHESDVPASELERRKRIVALAERMYLSDAFNVDEFDKYLTLAECVMDFEEIYIKYGKL